MGSTHYGGSVNRHNQFGKLWQYLLQMNRHLPQDSAISLLGYEHTQQKCGHMSPKHVPTGGQTLTAAPL